MIKTNKLILAFLALMTSSQVFAHSGGHGISGSASGLVSGFLHPFFGLDHVVAMVAVGLWGVFLGAKAVWTLPVVFPVIMASGAVLGILGVPVPFVEMGIALSALVLGLFVAFAVRPVLWIAAVVVGVFAIFHGYAHGAELPNATNPLTYSLGFVVATGLLHLGGIAFACLSHWRLGEVTVRLGGAIIAVCGVWFLAA